MVTNPLYILPLVNLLSSILDNFFPFLASNFQYFMPSLHCVLLILCSLFSLRKQAFPYNATTISSQLLATLFVDRDSTPSAIDELSCLLIKASSSGTQYPILCFLFHDIASANDPLLHYHFSQATGLFPYSIL